MDGDDDESESDCEEPFPFRPTARDETRHFLPPSSLEDSSDASAASLESGSASGLSGSPALGYSSPAQAIYSETLTHIRSRSLISRTDVLSINKPSLAIASVCTCQGKEAEKCGNDEDSSRKLCDVCIAQLYQDKNAVIALIDKARQDFFDPLFSWPPRDKQDEIFTEHLVSLPTPMLLLASTCRESTWRNGFGHVH